ncbi:MAG: nucleotide pyrophosphohydrolase [Nitrospiraceae bacterium]|nr:MAG: nucleotide pyrophosphohydrolase [Nitrospiraceae bacterium]
MSNELEDILEQLLKFRKERDWEQFHRPKELAISIVLEAAELLEEFQWKTDKEIRKYLKEGGLENVKDEVADIAVYILLLSHDLGIDLTEAIKKKLRKNEKKYPVEKAKGSAKKYDKL